MIGYKILRVGLQNFLGSDHVLRLNTDSITLGAVEIIALKKSGVSVVRKAYNRIAANYPTTFYAVTSGESSGMQQTTWLENTKRSLYTTRFALSDSGYTTSLGNIKSTTLAYNQDTSYKTGYMMSLQHVDTAISNRYSKKWGVLAGLVNKGVTWPYHTRDPIRQSNETGVGTFTLFFNADFIAGATFSDPTLVRFKLFDTERILVSFKYTPPSTSIVLSANGRSMLYRGNIYIDPATYGIVRFTYESVFIEKNGSSLVASNQQTDYAPLLPKSKKLVVARSQITYELRFYNPANTSDYYSVLTQFNACNLEYSKTVKVTLKNPVQPLLEPTLPLDEYRCQE